MENRKKGLLTDGEGRVFDRVCENVEGQMIESDSQIEIIENEMTANEALEKEITFRGVTGELQVTYCTYEGENWVVKYKNNPVIAGDDEYDFFVRSIDGNYAYLEMVRNAQQNEWSYPLLYNREIYRINVETQEAVSLNNLVLGRKP